MIVMFKNWRFGQKLGTEDCTYIKRWVFDFWFFTIRLHHWFYSDDLRNPHDHAWWFITIVLKGGYTDVSPDGDDVLSAGSVRFRRSTHQHSVKVNENGCWSILITGREKREWGFWVNGKFRKRNKYFFEHGHHDPC